MRTRDALFYSSWHFSLDVTQKANSTKPILKGGESDNVVKTADFRATKIPNTKYNS